MSNNNFGLLTEQGFLVGSGLGFQSIKEEELNLKKEETETKEKEENK